MGSTRSCSKSVGKEDAERDRESARLGSCPQAAEGEAVMASTALHPYWPRVGSSNYNGFYGSLVKSTLVQHTVSSLQDDLWCCVLMHCGV